MAHESPRKMRHCPQPAASDDSRASFREPTPALGQPCSKRRADRRSARGRRRFCQSESAGKVRRDLPHTPVTAWRSLTLTEFAAIGGADPPQAPATNRGLGCINRPRQLVRQSLWVPRLIPNQDGETRIYRSLAHWPLACRGALLLGAAPFCVAGQMAAHSPSPPIRTSPKPGALAGVRRGQT